MEHSCSQTSTAARVPIRFSAVKYPVITAHRQEAGRNAASSRSAGTVSGFPIQPSASRGAIRYRSTATAPLQRMLYRKQADRIRDTLSGLFLPSSSAVRYMAAVRTPAMPATMAKEPTDKTSCNSPMPAGPMRPER